MKKTGLLYALILLSMNAFAELTYQVSFPKASGHYLTISIEGDVEPGMHTFQMPVWTPGSYKVREFSQNVDVFFARLNGKEQYVQRSDKNTWSIHTEEKGRLKVTYEVYAFELGVRTSYVDLEKAFIHGVSAFMFWKGRETERIKLTIHRLKEWKNDFAALPKNDQGDYLVENYDLLADSPIAAGNLDSTTYESGGCPHTVVMIGKGNYDLNKISTDFKAISDVEVKMFGGVHPSERYVHFIQNVDKGGGGLEHLNSQTSQVNRWVYSDEKAYVSFLGLIAHEYFHLWNVKRIRPIELGPFDYNTENYTDLLWVAEGITSYYDDLMLFRAGYHDVETYLKVVSIAINRLENSAGKNVMPLHMASRLAWVKAYLSNENTKNVTVSYYNKGMLVAWLLDLRILELTKGKKRLDDVMRALYKDYQKTGSGFTVEEFEKTCSEVANYNLDGFFDEYVRSIHSPPYERMAKFLGVELTNKADLHKAFLGLNTKVENGKTVISFVETDGPAMQAGLSVNDEIIAFDGWRVNGDLTDEINRLNPEKEVEVIYSRDGVVQRCKLTPSKNMVVDYELKQVESPTSAQKKYFDLWLSK